jgi:hypothetical protein
MVPGLVDADTGDETEPVPQPLHMRLTRPLRRALMRG